MLVVVVKFSDDRPSELWY